MLTCSSFDHSIVFVRRWQAELRAGRTSSLIARDCRAAIRANDFMLKEEEAGVGDWFGRGSGAQTLPGSDVNAQVVAIKAQLDALVKGSK